MLLTPLAFDQVGYQIVIQMQHDLELKDQIALPGLEYQVGAIIKLLTVASLCLTPTHKQLQFHTSKYIYFKNDFMRELDQSEQFGGQCSFSSFSTTIVDLI